MLQDMLADLATARGWAPAVADLTDGIVLPVASAPGHPPAFALVVRPRGPGDTGSCYAATPHFLLSYRRLGGATPTPEETRRFLELMDAAATRLAEAPPSAPTLAWGETAAFLEKSGDQGEEHLLRIDFRCNQRCPFCFVRLGSLRLSPDEAATLLATVVKDPQRESVVLTGGEPTLHPQLFELAARIRSLGIRRISMQTNAVRFADRAFVARVIDAGIDGFMVSLHAHEPDAYDRLTDTRGLFPRAVEGIRNLRRMTGNITVNIGLNRLNVPVLSDHVDFVASLLQTRRRNGRIFFTLLNEYGHAKAPDLAVPLAVAGPALDAAIRRCRESRIRISPFFGDCAPPLCCLADPTPVIPRRTLAPPGAFHVADGAEIPPNQRVKRAACRSCRFDRICCGVPSAYGRLFGLDDLRPV
jgi:pyruvate-formate lyase-activating enzyme